MKNLFFITLFCLLSNICLGQINYPVIDEDGQPIQYGVGSLNSKIPIFLQTDRNAKLINPYISIPNDPLGTAVFLQGANHILVTTRLRKDSLSYYRYSIIENDTNVIASNNLLTKVNFTWNNKSSWPNYLTMDFGISEIANKKLTIKIYRLPDVNRVTTLIIYNKALKPAKILDKMLVTNGKFNKIINSYRNEVTVLNDGIALRIGEKTMGIFFSIKKTDLDFVYHIYLKHTVGREVDILPLSNIWEYNSTNGNPSHFINVSYFSRPGTYELIVEPKMGSNSELKNPYSQLAQISFKVLAPSRAYSIKELVLIFMCISITALLIIYLIRKKSKNKLVIANRQTEVAKDELNSVRSQLNPHFVFNALSGIQNLMNKNEVEMANDYLNRFARLTRNVLNENALISIKDEITLLEDYLSMEQLRFSFNYEIHIDNSSNFIHTEIPAMLLQPFVENA